MYDTPEKDAYRRAVWGAFNEAMGGRVEEAVGVLMPAKNGLEIAAAIRSGFREENLIAVDKNPALLATAPWRKQYPKVRIYGSEVSRAFARMAKDAVKVDVANLDFCGNFSMPVVESVRAIRDMAYQREGDWNFLPHAHPVWNTPSALGVTVLKGRESTATATALHLLGGAYKSDVEPRTVALLNAADHCDSVVAHGEYRSGKQVMAWGVGLRQIDECARMFYDNIEEMGHRTRMVLRKGVGFP